MRPRVSALVVAATLLAGARAHAQAAQASAPVGCRGYAFNTQSDGITGLPSSYPEITLVQPGSPVALAGVQKGDSIVAINGIDMLAWDPDRDRPRAPGDSVRMRFRRGTKDTDLVIVLGLRDAPTSANEPGQCRPLAKKP